MNAVSMFHCNSFTFEVIVVRAIVNCVDRLERTPVPALKAGNICEYFLVEQQVFSESEGGINYAAQTGDAREQSP
jgi:hypothetical protein